MMLDARARISGVPRQRERGDDRRNDGRRLLRQRLPGRAEPRAEDRQHVRRSRLGAAVGMDDALRAHLRRVPRPRRRRPRAGGMSARCDAFAPRPIARMLGLKIDVDTLRGTREGVPRLLEMLERHGVARDVPVLARPRPHRTRDPARLPPGLRRARCAARRSSRHYGVRTLLYGTLLPGPDIGRRARRACCARARRRATRPASTAGTTFAGRTASPPPTPNGRAREMQRACERYDEIFGEPPTHARRRRLADERARAAPHATARLRLLLGRPRHAPAPAGLARRADPLPAVSDDAADARRADRHRRRSPRTTSPRTCSSARATPRATGHVFTLHAELEGGSSRRCSSSCSPAGRRRAGRSARCARCATRSSRWRCRAARRRCAGRRAAPARCSCKVTNSWETSMAAR